MADIAKTYKQRKSNGYRSSVRYQMIEVVKKGRNQIVRVQVVDRGLSEAPIYEMTQEDFDRFLIPVE